MSVLAWHHTADFPKSLNNGVINHDYNVKIGVREIECGNSVGSGLSLRSMFGSLLCPYFGERP